MRARGKQVRMQEADAGESQFFTTIGPDPTLLKYEVASDIVCGVGHQDQSCQIVTFEGKTGKIEGAINIRVYQQERLFTDRKSVV